MIHRNMLHSRRSSRDRPGAHRAETMLLAPSSASRMPGDPLGARVEKNRPCATASWSPSTPMAGMGRGAEILTQLRPPSIRQIGWGEQSRMIGPRCRAAEQHIAGAAGSGDCVWDRRRRRLLREAANSAKLPQTDIFQRKSRTWRKAAAITAHRPIHPAIRGSGKSRQRNRRA